MRPSPRPDDDDALGDVAADSTTSLDTFACHSGLPSGVEREHVALVGADDDERRVGADAGRELLAGLDAPDRAAGRGIDADDRAVAAAA